jgi:hypothetical protein
MSEVLSFPFVSNDSSLGEIGFRPILPITLMRREATVNALALLDTGASVNVLPYGIGLNLGLAWERQTTILSLTGNLAQHESRLVTLQGKVGEFKPVKFAFAWTQAETVPLILGQVNFFLEFDVCFYRSLQFFDVRRRSNSSSGN